VRTVLLLVEDDVPTRQRLARLLRLHEGLDEVIEAGGCAEALACMARRPPDILLTDLGLPDGSGVALIRHLAEHHPGARSLVISAFGDEASVIEALCAGASGYLLKDASNAGIRRALRDLAEGGVPLSPAVARYLLKRLPSTAGSAPAAASAPLEPAPAPLLEPLSARELQVLQLIADGASYAEIAQRLFISLNTVNTHIRHLYGKLAVGSRGKAVKVAERYGLLPRAS
jgi:DNA-binding NarL/FixJ family response regulator